MMCSKPLDKSTIRKILVISLTNIGDVVLTFPVIDTLWGEFPDAKMSLVIGPKAETLFRGHSRFSRVYVFNKRQPLRDTWRLIMELRQEQFDMVIDLRNTAVPLFLGAKYSTSLLATKTNNSHMKAKHLRHLQTVYPSGELSPQKKCLVISEQEHRHVQELLAKGNIRGKFAAIAPGAAHKNKCWSEKGFAEVADYLFTQHGLQVIFVGDRGDQAMIDAVSQGMTSPSISFCGQTNLCELAEILRGATLLISNDSAPMHLASYLDIPVVALFGSSDPVKYGPWGRNGTYIQKNDLNNKGKLPIENDRSIILRISVEDVIRSIKTIANAIQAG